MTTKLYNYFRSSSSYRVRIALNVKRLSYEYVSVHLLKDGGQHRLPEFLAKNPMGQVPVFEHEGKYLSQSMAILLYLEEIDPAPPLFGNNAWMRAKIVEVCEVINSGIQPLQNVGVLNELTGRFGADDKARAAWCAHWIEKGLSSVENFLKDTAGEYSFGDEITAADCFLIPQMYAARRFGANVDQYRLLQRIEKNCLSLEAFRRAEPSVQPDANV